MLMQVSVIPHIPSSFRSDSQALLPALKFLGPFPPHFFFEVLFPWYHLPKSLVLYNLIREFITSPIIMTTVQQ